MKRNLLILCSVMALAVACRKNEDTTVVNPDPTIKPDDVKPNVVLNTLLPYGQGLVKDSTWPDGKGHTFFMEGEAHDVLARYADRIYLGAVIKGNSIADSSYNLVTGYTSKPITASASLVIPAAQGAMVATMNTPSLPATQNFVKGLFDKGFTTPVAENLFWSGPGKVFYNKRQLSLTGLGTPAMLSGKEPIGGFSCYLSVTFYTVDMDLPPDGKLFKEALTETTLAEDPAYVSGISYGRAATLLITLNTESADTINKLQVAFNTVVNGNPVTSEQQQLMNKATTTAFIRDESSGDATAVKVFQGETGFRTILQQIRTSPIIGADKPGIPLSFELRSLKDFSLVRHLVKINYSE